MEGEPSKAAFGTFMEPRKLRVSFAVQLWGVSALRLVEAGPSRFHFEHAHVLVCTCLPGMASDAFRFAELAVNSGDKMQSVDEVWLTPFIARATDSPSVKRGLVYALRIPSHYGFQV
ncbi:hypothetical protein NMY22_g18283 [Coprinellus aureogranulatus]|nr:hypothetical protein NMY22_g18283 [Coprinellus aureogranulatus]